MYCEYCGYCEYSFLVTSPPPRTCKQITMLLNGVIILLLIPRGADGATTSIKKGQCQIMAYDSYLTVHTRTHVHTVCIPGCMHQTLDCTRFTSRALDIHWQKQLGLVLHWSLQISWKAVYHCRWSCNDRLCSDSRVRPQSHKQLAQRPYLYQINERRRRCIDISGGYSTLGLQGLSWY